MGQCQACAARWELPQSRWVHGPTPRQRAAGKLQRDACSWLMLAPLTCLIPAVLLCRQQQHSWLLTQMPQRYRQLRQADHLPSARCSSTTEVPSWWGMATSRTMTTGRQPPCCWQLMRRWQAWIRLPTPAQTPPPSTRRREATKRA